MLKNKLPPMAGGSDGPCDSSSGSDDCREFDVICIEAKRVCDFCFQEHRVERQTTTTVTGVGTTAICTIDEANIFCREVERRKVDDGKKKVKELVCVAIEVPVLVTITGPGGTQTITDRIVFLKQAVLCAPTGTIVECQVTGECCCFVDPTTGVVTCVFDFCVVLSTKIIVRVLVPTMGECPPKRCRATVLGCPPKVPEECKHCTCDD